MRRIFHVNRELVALKYEFSQPVNFRSLVAVINFRSRGHKLVLLELLPTFIYSII